MSNLTEINFECYESFDIEMVEHYFNVKVTKNNTSLKIQGTKDNIIEFLQTFFNLEYNYILNTFKELE